MPRVHVVKKARASKKERKCQVCGHEVQVGETYRYADQRIGYPRFASRRLIWCKDHGPNRYTFVQNPKVEAQMRAEDGLMEALAGEFTVEEAEEAFRIAADDIREIAEMHRESAENIEEGFGHPTQLSEEFEEKADACEQAAEQLEDANSEFPEEPDFENPDELEEEADSEYYEDAQRAWEDWRDEVRNLGIEYINEAEV